MTPDSTTPIDSYFANTPYARRLERRKRASEQKLSWQDFRRFGEFVTPFK